MASSENEPAVSATDAVAKRTDSPLLSLPTEIWDQILEDMFTFAEPIELSPIEPTVCDLTLFNLGPSQYQRALDYQQCIRPTLCVLRTCKAILKSGAVAYYGKNEFRFSSPLGGLVLAKFLDLIGPTNVSRLKHITVAHPVVWQPPASRRHFFIRRLSPFGMADLADYVDTYNATPSAAPLKDPLSTLQSIQDLKSLTFLFYGLGIDSPFHEVVLFEYNTKGLLAHPVNAMAWNKFPDLQVKLINLHAHDDSAGTAPSIRLKVIDTALSDPQALAGHHSAHPAVANAIQIIHQMRSQGWTFDDTILDHYTGVWPLKQLPDGSVEDPNICKDWEGWHSRECLEEWWVRRILNDGDGVGYKGCVKCWRASAVGLYATRDKCDCADGGTFMSAGWKGPDILIGNPGVPITVDASVTDAKKGDVMWKKSAAVKDMDGLDTMGDEEVFNMREK